ncbi:MAG: hypothetical protein SOR79_06530 [Blautia sp.]|nr:hypothetical protein [Blautia sp.]MDY3016790.1 hypothetical protein [Blautia sp.]
MSPPIGAARILTGIPAFTIWLMVSVISFGRNSGDSGEIPTRPIGLF